MNENENKVNPAEDELPKSTETPAAEATVEAAPAAEAVPAGKPKFKLKLPHIIAGVAAAAAVVVIGVASAASGPASLVGKSLSKTVDALPKNEVVALLTNVAKGGSVEALVDLDNITNGMLDGSASVKVYANEKKEAAVVAEVTVDDEVLLDAGVYVTENDLALNSKALLDEEAYGINLKNLTKNFNDSVFGPHGPYELDIELDEDSDPIVEKSLKMAEDAEALAKDIAENTLKALKKNAEMSKETVSKKFASEKVKVTAVKMAMDNETMVGFVEDMVNYASKDKKIKSFLNEYAEFMMTTTGGDPDDAEDFIEDFYDALEDVDMEDVEEAMEDLDLEVEAIFYISKSGKSLVGLDLDFDVDGESISFTSTFGPAPDKLDEISFELSAPYTEYSGSYVVKEDTKQNYSAEFELDLDGDEVEGTFEWDRKGGDFEFEIDDSYSVYGAEGNLILSTKEAVLVLESIYEDDDDIDLGLTLTAKANDKMPSMPKYTDVLEMSEDDVEDLVEDIQDTLEDLVYSLSPF